MFQNLHGSPQEEIAILNADGSPAIQRVLNSLDHVSFLTQPGMIDEDTVMPWMNLMIVKVWFKLGPYVEYERTHWHEPDYYLTVKKLVERCTRWQQKHISTGETTWLDDSL